MTKNEVIKEIEDLEHVLEETTNQFIRGFNKMKKSIETLKKGLD